MLASKSDRRHYTNRNVTVEVRVTMYNKMHSPYYALVPVG